jgi:hypothetical protein
MIVARNGRYLPKTGHDHGALTGEISRHPACRTPRGDI